ncbi:MAG TPA: tail fiber protein [Verrucomicrobiota bacterium]|nr:hypothetical protein [Verrucomicrobiales bacterium]HRI11529.1 tail fiber protein [Verrucomicrobiota bacterium]
MNPIRLALFLTFSLLGARNGWSQVAAPKLLPFQGRLTDPNGAAVPDGVRLIQFKIYEEPSGGSPRWSGELHRTTVNGGLVNVILGTKSPFPPEVDFDRQLYLEITVDVSGPEGRPDNAITPADPPMLPRQAILPVVFAKEAADSRLLDGHDWSSLFVEGVTNPATARIDGGRLGPGSVTAAQIKPFSLTGSLIASNTITSAHMAGAVIGTDQISTNSINLSHLTLELIQDLMNPPGTIIAWMGTNSVPPAGWEFCWGQVLDGDQPKYVRLFSVIGFSSGKGDGGKQFRVPDLRGMFLRGVTGNRDDGYQDFDANSRVPARGTGNGQNRVGSVQANAFKAHFHGTANNTPNNNGGSAYNTGNNRPPNPTHVMWGAAAGGNVDAQNSESVGGSETRPNNVYVHYLIKL